MSRSQLILLLVAVICCGFVCGKNIEIEIGGESSEVENVTDHQSESEVSNIISDEEILAESDNQDNETGDVVADIVVPTAAPIVKVPVTDTPIKVRQSILGLPEEIPELDNDLASRIKFIIFKDGRLVYSYDEYDRKQNVSLNLYCNGEGNITFIIHGWRESSDTEWVQLLVSKYTQYRTGCVIAIDYEKLAYRPYSRLLTYFNAITDILYSTIRVWESQGINLNKTHIFGFDFGGRIALKLGEKLGSDSVLSIDVCDIAGPGFDDKFPYIDYRKSAQNVQCIHTSRDKGTQNYSNCHQNWRLGICGFNQVGADMSPLTYSKYKSSHRICPYYYLLSFEENIYAQDKPFECSATHLAENLPDDFKMGFLETRKSEVQGELFVTKPPPYSFKDSVSNVEENSTINKIMEYYREEIIGLKDSPSTIERFENTIISAIRGIEPAVSSLFQTIG